MLWSPPAEGIKFLNGINHTKGTWQGSMLTFNKNSKEIAKEISSIVLNDLKIGDNFKGGLPLEVNSSGDELINSQDLISERISLKDVQSGIEEYKQSNSYSKIEYNCKIDFREQQ